MLMLIDDNQSTPWIAGCHAPCGLCKERGTQHLIFYSHPSPQYFSTVESPTLVDASHFRRISSSFGLQGSDELGRVIRIEVIIHG